MTTSLVDAESVLAVDLGSVLTRVLLFDTVDGQYRFIASGVAPSTAGAPYSDIGEGINQALYQLQEVTGRVLVDPEGRLIMPAQPDGSGLDRLTIVFSAGPELRVVTVGLLEDVSLESANRLVEMTYGQVVEQIGINDRRRPEVQVDAILQARPDLVLLAGGADRGATRSVAKMVELITLALQTTLPEQRPDILYAGNQVLAKRLKEVLSKLTTVHLAPNIRPSIDLEELEPASEVLAQVIGKVRSSQVGGLEGLGKISTTPLIPAAQAFGRMIGYLSKIYDPQKGVLGVDLGQTYSTIAAGVGGQTALRTFPLGMGAGIQSTLADLNIEDVSRWLPVPIGDDVLRDYLWQRSLRPGMVPVTVEALAMEQAAARHILTLMMQGLQTRWPDLHNAFEPILAAGSVLSQWSSPGQSLLTILDGLQPVGITTVLLDAYGLLGSLGSISSHNALMPVQVLESNAFINLGTVICPLSEGRYGTPLLKVRIEYESGEETQLEVRQGMLTALPIRNGQTARIHFSPLRRVVIDPNRKDRIRSFKVVGGLCGAVIDTRGRPLVLPRDAARRRDMIRKWQTALGGSVV
ncbi:MAG TPA: glutamate mutase L [Anaerolineaceae bacterium]|mgnify:FL=1|nr:glutamate mutase L [Longilinea sp.]HOG79316.1 glutamate mutase L [Anaerolineaceae bacterium]